jgi:polysaccharide transporter, PST family
MGGGGILLCAGVCVTAPFLVRVTLGQGYEPAIHVMRILSLLLPAIGLSSVLGIQWMLPLGMDAVFNKIIVSVGVLNVALAMWWAPRWQHAGMAWAVVFSEWLVTLTMTIVLWRRRMSPLSRDPDLPVPVTGASDCDRTQLESQPAASLPSDTAAGAGRSE